MGLDDKTNDSAWFLQSHENALDSGLFGRPESREAPVWPHDFHRFPIFDRI